MPDKEEILKQVGAAIEREARLDMHTHPVTVAFVDGALTLAGEVQHIAVKRNALRAAGTVPGVRWIVDELRVAAGQPPGDGVTRDAVGRALLADIDFQNCALHMRVKGQRETLREAGADPSGSIEIAIDDGVITLSGHVISLSHKRLAGALVWWSPGCRDVVNRLEIVPPEEDNDDEITDALRLVLETDPYVHADRITVSSRDRTVTLEGVVASVAERERAEEDAWYTFAVSKVVNRIEVR